MEKKRMIISGSNNIFVKFWNFCWEIYYKNPEIWNYLIVGGLTTVVSLGVKYGLLFTILDAKDAFELQVAVIVSWVAAVLFAYVTNRVFVFHSKSKAYLKELISFFAGRVLTLLMEMAIMFIFVTWLGLNSDMWVVVFTIIVQILVTIFNYILSKIFVFKKES